MQIMRAISSATLPTITIHRPLPSGGYPAATRSTTRGIILPGSDEGYCGNRFKGYVGQEFVPKRADKIARYGKPIQLWRIFKQDLLVRREENNNQLTINLHDYQENIFNGRPDWLPLHRAGARIIEG